jgi:tetratricopeptide (TPR) repeat protein
MSSHNVDSDYISKAEQEWELARLFGDMEAQQLKPFTPAQQRNLKMILLGFSPKEASRILIIAETSLKPAFSGLYRLIENLTGQPETTVTYKNAPPVLASYRKGAIAADSKFDLLGRDDDRAALRNLSTQHKIVLIKAGAGVGKSTLAREFLSTQFEKVIRLEMGLESGSVTPAEEKVAQILRKDFDEEPSRDFGINLEILRTRLSDRVCAIGVLIDNLEPALDENYRFREKLRGYEAVLGVLGDRDVCSFTLITSRRSLIADRVTVREYLLAGLDITAWRQYFHDCGNVEISEALMAMCIAYHGNAKVMDILHSAILNRFNGDIESYWQRYKDTLLADVELETLISLEMDWLCENQPEPYNLLCRMSCYRYQDVKTVPFEALTCLLWDVAESRHTWVVEYLSKTSLIEVKNEYYLHPAVREAALSRLRANEVEWESSNLNAAEFWISYLHVILSIKDALTIFEAYHHYFSVNKNELAARVITLEVENCFDTNEPLGISFYRYGLLDSIKPAIEAVIKSVPNGYELARIHNILGDACWMMGDIHKAIDLHEESKKIAVEFNLEALECVAFFNIGLCQVDLWNIELAMKNFKKCISLSKGTTYWNYEIDAYFCLSFLNSELGFKENTIGFANHVLLNKKPIYSTWALGYKWLFLGKAYINLSEFQQSLEMYKNALDYAEDSNYPQVKANSFIGFAIIARNHRDWSQAILYHHQSIDILRKLGARCDLAEAHLQFGLTYQAIEDDEQAEEHKTRAIELFTQIEAPKQCDRVDRLFAKALSPPVAGEVPNNLQHD